MINAQEAFDVGARLAIAHEANFAPSVHNIQPARFRFLDDGAIAVLEDRRRRLPVADPHGSDSWKSLGAAAEGLAMALSARGFAAHVVWSEADAAEPLRTVARVTVAGDVAPDRLRSLAAQRATWRGPFAARDVTAERALDAIRGADDLTLVEDRDAIADIARRYDDANIATLRDTAYRLELRAWMRLSRFHANWSRDGLNARAMGMSAAEAFGADIVLGKRAFGLFDGMGVASALTAEAPRVRSAAAVGLFHRPAEEHDFDTGRRFYRLWLEIEAAGLVLCPMSVLADMKDHAQALKRAFGVDDARKLVTVFRIGRRPAHARPPRRARLPAHKLLV
ncbi:MAG: hypothetical protein NW200_07255 [Hyphomonadaceae bacterium]|nr:hypothetical protein [Hyphomonadaceae bacterium]